MLFFRMRQPLLLLALALFALLVFVKAAPPFPETTPGTDIDNTDDTGNAIDPEPTDEMPSDDGKELDAGDEWADGENGKSVDEFGDPVSVADDTDAGVKDINEAEATHNAIDTNNKDEEDPFAEEPTESDNEMDEEEDPFAVSTDDDEGTASSTGDGDEEDPPATLDDEMDPIGLATEESDDADPFAVDDKEDIGSALATDSDESEIDFDDNELSSPTEKVASDDDHSETTTEETNGNIGTSDSDDAEFPENYPTANLDEDDSGKEVDGSDEEVDSGETSTANDDANPEDEINEDGTIGVDEETNDLGEDNDGESDTSDKVDDAFDKAVANDGDELEESNGEDEEAVIKGDENTPEDPNVADETHSDAEDATETPAPADDDTSEEATEEKEILTGHETESESDKVQQQYPDVQPAADHATHDSEAVQENLDPDTTYSGVNDEGFDYTHYGSTNGNNHVQYQGAILIAAVGVVGLFVVKRSRDTILQGVQKLSGRQSNHGQYSHVPLNATDGDAPNQNLSNTTSEWAVDMSNAIDHDHQDESKPSRGMKLNHATKPSHNNSIPLRPVQDRKSQEWSDWKEDEEDW